MSINPLNDISRVYLEKVAESHVPGKPAEKLGAVTAIPKDEQEAARQRTLAKAKAMREKKGIKEAAKPDYLDFDKDGNKKESMKKALRDKAKQKMEEAKKPNDGNLANNYPPYDKITRGDVIAGRLGKDEMGGKKKVAKEAFSNWREDLIEVADKVEGNKSKDQRITEKQVNNKIVINPKLDLGEAIENLGGQLLEMVEIESFDSIFDDLSESEIFLLTDDLIEEVVEEFFQECLEEGYDPEYIENTLVESIELSAALLNEAKVTLGHDTKIKSDRLEKVKSAVKKVGGAVARGAGYVAGAAVRGAKAAGREFAAGYSRGRGGSSSQASAPSTSTASSTGSSRPGLLGRIGSALKSGLKRAIASGARSVSRGARNIARRMETGEAPKAAAPAPTSAPKAAAKPKAKAPAKSKRGQLSSKADELLADIRKEETEIDEAKQAFPFKKVEAQKEKARKGSVYGRDTGNSPVPQVSDAEKKATTRFSKMQHTYEKEKRAKQEADKSKRSSTFYKDTHPASAPKMKKANEEFQLDEKTLTAAETKKKEEIVKSMKDKAADFEKRYPGRGKEVMYATATKVAKKVAEQAMELQPKTQTTATPNPQDTAKAKVAAQRAKSAEINILQRRLQAIRQTPAGTPVSGIGG